MPKYTHQAGAAWPESLIQLTNYKDADNTVGSIIAQIKAFQEAGDFDAAQELIDMWENTLKPYVLDSSAINKYVEEIRNLEIYAKARKQQIFYDKTGSEVDTFAGYQDVWIGNNNQDSGSIIAKGNVSVSEVLEGRTFSNAYGTDLVGTMIDNGAINETIDPGDSFVIPAGYHNGQGIITANNPESGGGGGGGGGSIYYHPDITVNGFKQITPLNGCSELDVWVKVPTIMTGTKDIPKGTSTFEVDRAITNFIYVFGMTKPTGTTAHYSMYCKVDNSAKATSTWKNAQSSSDYRITKAPEGNKITIKWASASTITYFAW